MTSNVGASVIEKGGRSFGFFLRPDDEEAEQVRADSSAGTGSSVCACHCVIQTLMLAEGVKELLAGQLVRF